MIYLKKRNNLLNLCILLIVLFALFCLDNTKLKKYIGYQKVKSYVLIDYNLYPLTEKFFGKGIFNFYNLDINVSNEIIDEIQMGEYTLVYQSNDKLYSTFLGSVSKINKKEDCYDVYISLRDCSIILCNLKEVEVFLYQKIEANTLIASLEKCEVGYYYFYKKI